MSFLSKIFGRKEEIPVSVEIKIGNLKNWLFENVVDLKRLNKLYERVNLNIIKIKKNLEDLDNVIFVDGADVRLKGRISDRINSYKKQVNIFLNKVENLDKEKFKDYCYHYFLLADDFNKASLQSFYMIQAVFPNNIKNVGASLSELDNNFKEIKHLVYGQNFEDFDNILIKINEFNENQKIFDDLNEKYNNKLKELEEFNKEIDNLEKKRASFEESDIYNEIKKLKKEEDELQTEKTVLNSILIDLFAPLDRVMKKYERLDEKSVVINYNKGLSYLFEDKEFLIVNELIKIKDNINNLESDEKKKEKAINRINEINNEKLSKLVERWNKINNRINEINDILMKNETSKLGIGFNYRISTLKVKIERLNEEILKLNKKEIKFNKEEYFNWLNKNAKNLTGINVYIKN